jgi:hypothetical protein
MSSLVKREKTKQQRRQRNEIVILLLLLYLRERIGERDVDNTNRLKKEKKERLEYYISPRKSATCVPYGGQCNAIIHGMRHGVSYIAMSVTCLPNYFFEVIFSFASFFLIILT